MKSIFLLILIAFSLAQESCHKTLFLNRETDLDPIRNCVRFTGNIIFHASEYPISINLPQLIEINGSLLISGCHITAIDLPNLSRVSQVLTITSVKDLQSIQLSSLRDASSLILNNITSPIPISFKAGVRTNSFTMTDTRLTSIEGVEIERASNSIRVTNNTRLERIQLDHLKEIERDLIFIENPILETVHFPELVRVGNQINFQDNLLLSELSFEKLERVDNHLRIVSPDLTKLNLGRYRLSSGSTIHAPINCSEFKTLYMNAFDEKECDRQVSEYQSRLRVPHHRIASSPVPTKNSGAGPLTYFPILLLILCSLSFLYY